MRKYIKALSLLLPMLTAITIQYMTVVALNLIYMGIIGFQNTIGRNNVDGKTATEGIERLTPPLPQSIIYLFSIIAIIVCGIVFFFWYRQETQGKIRGKLKALFTVKNILLFILLGIGCQFFVSGIMGLLQPYFAGTFEEYSETIENLFSGKDIVVLLLLVFVAPIAEELIFRGMILHRATSMMTFFEANMLQSVLFGFYHGNVIQGIYATVLGLLLGLVYHKFKTIYAPIFLHMMVNASALIMLFLPEADYVHVILLVIGGLLTGVTSWFLVLFSGEEANRIL